MGHLFLHHQIASRVWMVMSVTCFTHLPAQRLFMSQTPVLNLLRARHCFRNCTESKQLSYWSFHFSGPDNQQTANFSWKSIYTTQKVERAIGDTVVIAGVGHCSLGWPGKPYSWGWPEIWEVNRTKVWGRAFQTREATRTAAFLFAHHRTKNKQRRPASQGQGEPR